MIATTTLRLTYQELEAILLSLDYYMNNVLRPNYVFRENYTKAYDHIFTKIEEIERRNKNGTNKSTEECQGKTAKT